MLNSSKQKNKQTPQKKLNFKSIKGSLVHKSRLEPHFFQRQLNPRNLTPYP